MDPPYPFQQTTAMLRATALLSLLAVLPAAEESLDLRAATEAAFAKNRSFLDARSAVLRARLGVTVANANVFAPQLKLGYQVRNAGDDTGDARAELAMKSMGFNITPYIRMGLDGEAGTTPAGNQVPQTTSAVGLSISRALFNISEHLAQRLPVDEAEQSLFSAANTLIIRARQLELSTARSFLAVQKAEARLAVRERRVADAEAFLKSVRDRVDHGFAAPLDGLNAEIDLNQAQADLNGERTSLASARQELNDVLGRALQTEFQLVAEDVGPARISALAAPPIDDDVARMLSGNEDLGTQARAIDLAIQRLRVRRDQLAPQVVATVSGESRTIAPAFSDGVRDEKVASLGLTWTMPLDGFQAARANALIAEDELTAALRARDDRRAELERDLRNLHRQIVQARAAVTLGERRLEVERARLDATLRRYEAGLVDNLEVTRAKQSVDSAELGLLDGRIGVILLDAEYRSKLPVRPTLLGGP